MTSTESTTKKDGKPSAGRAYELLAAKLKENASNSAVHRRIAAHIRAKTGQNIALPLFHQSSDFEDEFKIETYKECVTAIVNRDYSKLQGDVGQGDKQLPAEVVQPPVVPVVVENKRATQPTTTRAEPPKIPQQDRLPTPVPQPVAPVKVIEVQHMDPISAAVLKTLQPHIERIIDERITHAMGNGAFPVDRVKQIVTDALTENRRPSKAAPEIVASLEVLVRGLNAILESITKPAEELYHPLHALKSEKPTTPTK